jgi:hypothetical protein
MPVPADAPAPPTRHPKLGMPVRTWCYTDAAGRTLGFVNRFQTADGKVFRPLTLMRSTETSSLVWRWEALPQPRPLYGLAELAKAPSAPVVVTEGEKAADAARALLPGFAVVTSPNGSASAAQADWSPMRGRRVTIWPDADPAGLAFANTVAKLALAAGAEAVAIVSPPAECPVGWDAADAQADGWTTDRAAGLIATARPAAAPGAVPTDNSQASGQRRLAQRDVLLALTHSVELWHDANRVAYATYPVRAHHESWPVQSRDFKMWLAGRYYEETRGAIGSQLLEDTLRILEARAVHEGPLHTCSIRVAHSDGALYLDLGDEAWRAVEITKHDWRVVSRPPVKLLRSSAIRPLPEPEAGVMIEVLRGFLNVQSDADFQLVVAWIVAALRDRGPYPILVVNGEQGSGKSIFSRMVRSLVDPSAAPIRAMPKDDRDLVVSAANAHVMAFDNLSTVPAWLSDGLCRLATGSGFATRMLHTDRDESIFEAARPIIVNGIPQLTDRADLADRAITIHLAAIREEARRPGDEMLAAFDAARPGIIGALLTAMSAAQRNLPEVKLDRAPRMADFAKWIAAAEPGLGWKPGTFAVAYAENRRDVSDATFEADPVALAVRDFLAAEHPEGWTATAAEWLAALTPRAPEAMRRARLWPDTPQKLGNAVERAAPLLRRKGFTIMRRHSGNRLITIDPPAAAREENPF